VTGQPGFATLFAASPETEGDGAGASGVGAGRDRKAEHIRLALDRRMQIETNSFDAYRFEHEALPEIDLEAIDVSVELLGRRLAAPILISCMTGGTETAARINRNLAAGAEATRVAIGVGSQRKALEDPEQARTFQIRDRAPSVPLLGNLGAVQLNYSLGLADCRKAVDMIGADALVLHLNPLQEAIQPEGQTRFAALLPKIGAIVRELGVPVVVKEVGSGLSSGTARRLVEQGVRFLDTAGVGGTSWARIEAERAGDLDLGEVFADWGLPTPESIAQIRSVAPLTPLAGGLLKDRVTLIGSGGIRHGLDAAKAIALGADLVGMAYPFLGPANESAERVAAKVERTIRELKISMFCLGVKSIAELQTTKLRKGM
jgi:isopentenyl-diphosphate delta-isomerase